MNICLVISSLTCGGAERVVATLAEKFQNCGHTVTIITISSVDTDFYTVPSAVNRNGLDKLQDSKGLVGAILGNLSRVRSIRSAVKSASADIVVSHLTETNILAIIAGLGSSIPVVITEHCDPVSISYGRVWTVLRRLVYPYANMLVSVSKGVDDYFSWLPRGRKRIIYNPFFIPAVDSSSPSDSFSMVDLSGPVMVSMGRFTHQKGFDILLRAFASLAKEHPAWTLIILGDGALRGDLEQITKELGITSRVLMPGRLSDPFTVLRNADLFVMSSRFEGFPMAHGEAMLCGLPVIATDCPSGPSELIRDGVDGCLVPNGDQKGLEEAMDRLMSDGSLRQKMSESAVQVTDRFNVEEIVDEWLDFLASLSNPR